MGRSGGFVRRWWNLRLHARSLTCACDGCTRRSTCVHTYTRMHSVLYRSDCMNAYLCVCVCVQTCTHKYTAMHTCTFPLPCSAYALRLQRIYVNIFRNVHVCLHVLIQKYCSSQECTDEHTRAHTYTRTQTYTRAKGI